MAFCTKCGTQLPAGAQFCPNCGAAQQMSMQQPQQLGIVQQPQVGTNGYPDYNNWYLSFMKSYMEMINALNAQQGVQPKHEEPEELIEEPVAEIEPEEVAVEAQPKKGFKLASWPALLLLLFGASLFGVFFLPVIDPTTTVYNILSSGEAGRAYTYLCYALVGLAGFAVFFGFIYLLCSFKVKFAKTFCGVLAILIYLAILAAAGVMLAIVAMRTESFVAVGKALFITCAGAALLMFVTMIIVAVCKKRA